MPRFSTSLPPKSANHGYTLRRTPPAAPIRAIITSERLTVCDTHFYHGRTCPCEREVNEQGKTIDDSRCPACRDKQSWRTHAYLSAYDVKAHEHFIFECTDAAAKPLEEYFTANGTLRGCCLNAYRAKQAANSKVTIIATPTNLQNVSLPAAPDVTAALCVLWRIPREGFQFLPEPSGRDQLTPPLEALARMRTPPDNAESEEAFLAHRQAVTDAIAAAASGNGKPKRKPVPA